MRSNARAIPMTAPIDLARFGGTPREVRLTREGIAMMIVAVVLAAAAIVAGIALSIAHAAQSAQVGLLQREGVAAAARIVAMSRPRGDDGERSVTYDYDAGGRAFTGAVRLRRREWQTLAVGDTIAVRYVRSEPGRAWVRGHEPRVLPIVLVPVVVTVLAALAGSIALRVRRNLTLLSEGRFALGRVIAVKKQPHGVHRLTYEFTTLSGATVKGRYDTKRRAPDVGSLVPIVYHRENPRRTALYPLSFVAPAKDRHR